MNYLRGDFNVIDMDSFEIYIQWEGGYPYATKGRGDEYSLSHDQELELMAEKIVRLESELANNRKGWHDEIEDHSNTRQQLDSARATGGQP